MIDSFGIRFFISSIAISILIISILFVKRYLKKHISLRIQYNIWFLLLVMLAIPFLPIKLPGLGQLYSWFTNLGTTAVQNAGSTASANVSGTPVLANNWMQDFTLSVNQDTSSFLNFTIIVLWITGICVMAGLTLRSHLKIKQLLHSALPVQNQRVRLIFTQCRQDIGIKKTIPLYSSAYLQSPIFVGLFKPSIILPIHLISDFKEKDIRFILIHELQHYRYKDIFINYLICLARIVYWFHPLVWTALKEMRNDREIACDAAVLQMLDKDSYGDYGHTLLHFAERISHSSFSSAAGMGGTKKQITKRIINIAYFRTESRWLKIKSILIFLLITSIVLGSAPLLTAGAAMNSHYTFTDSNASKVDLSSYFEGYEGSFVLYDTATSHWDIYNESQSTKRVSPDSTYKIYSALFGLESGSISPDDSYMTWDQTEYPFESWNQNQELNSAIANSVNWYFLGLDKMTGMSAIEKCIEQANYGNKDLSGGISRYWMESSLKISPIEQVELLNKFYHNEFGFEMKNIQAVKDALLLSTTGDARLYGKTGTGDVEGKNINGWFIGFVEKNDRTYFFASNIQGDDFANGSMASKIALNILSDKNIYKES